MEKVQAADTGGLALEIIVIDDGSCDSSFVRAHALAASDSRIIAVKHDTNQGNHFPSLLSNILTDINLTDMEVCYKVFRREILDWTTLNEDLFGFNPEITAKISHMKPPARIYEVGIRYLGRTYEEGKKIGWKDGIRVVLCILRYNLFR